MIQNASLTLVGSGIKFLAQLTNEAQAYINQSDLVLYLVNDPMMKEWIKENAKTSESLDDLYASSEIRAQSYKNITDYIIESVKKGQHVCLVFYGHPCHFSQPGLHAIHKAKELGIKSKILPGISAEDCLIADLAIDSGQAGIQSFDATDLLLYQRQFDARSHLILWQIDVIGDLTHKKTGSNHHGAQLLKEYLLKQYDSNHQVILYEAAIYPGCDPTIKKIPLHKFSTDSLTPITSMYIPPLNSVYDKKAATDLGIKLP